MRPPAYSLIRRNPAPGSGSNAKRFQRIQQPRRQPTASRGELIPTTGPPALHTGAKVHPCGRTADPVLLRTRPKVSSPPRVVAESGRAAAKGLRAAFDKPA